jgi:hypothetical protein
MFHKLAILTILLVALGGALLVLRQERLEVANQNANLYWQIQQTRQAIWSAQADTAVLLRPGDLQRRIERARLHLEPFDPTRRMDPAGGWVQAPEARHASGVVR